MSLDPNDPDPVFRPTGSYVYDKLLELAKGQPTFGDMLAAEEEIGVRSIDSAYEQKLCDTLEIDVLGETEDGKIVIFSEYHRKMVTINRDIDRLGYSKMTQMFGPPVKANVHRAKDPVEDMFTVDDVRDAIAQIAGKRRLDDNSIAGIGCWPRRDEFSKPMPGVVMVGAGEAAIVEGPKIKRITTPHDNGRLLGISGSDPWYDYGTVARYVQNFSHEWAGEVIEELAEVFYRWRWNDEMMPFTLAGTVIATWTQALWTWRPHVSITGKTNSGKSLLMDTLGDFFGRLSQRSSKSSAAGIRQAVKTSSKVPLIDEFEDSRHRREILEMARAASRGDEILLGSPNQKVNKYTLHQIFYFAAIESGLDRAPDRNRFISLELLTANKGEQGKLRPPSTEEMRTLGMKSLAISIRCIAEAREMALWLKSTKHDGIDPRIIESYSVPSAMLAVAAGDDRDEACKLLGQILRYLPTEKISDEEDLLQAILGHVVRWGRQEESTIATLIQKGGMDATEALERNGIVLAYSNPGARSQHPQLDPDFLFVAHKDVRAKLLKGTDWERQSINQILQRIDGASRSRRRIAGRLTYGIDIPMLHINENYLGDTDESRTIEHQGNMKRNEEFQ